MKTEISVIQCK